MIKFVIREYNTIFSPKHQKYIIDEISNHRRVRSLCIHRKFFFMNIIANNSLINNNIYIYTLITEIKNFHNLKVFLHCSNEFWN